MIIVNDEYSRYFIRILYSLSKYLRKITTFIFTLIIIFSKKLSQLCPLFRIFQHFRISRLIYLFYISLHFSILFYVQTFHFVYFRVFTRFMCIPYNIVSLSFPQMHEHERSMDLQPIQNLSKPISRSEKEKKDTKNKETR